MWLDQNKEVQGSVEISFFQWPRNRIWQALWADSLFTIWATSEALYGKRELTDVIELRIMIQEDYPGLSSGPL